MKFLQSIFGRRLKVNVQLGGWVLQAEGDHNQVNGHVAIFYRVCKELSAINGANATAAALDRAVPTEAKDQAH